MDDRYQVKGKIGQGGIGSVYQARDTRMNRDVAIKRLTTLEGPDSDKSTKKLLQEAGALASVQHPNIVTVYDVGVDDDGAFVVMELIGGDTLEDIVSNGSFLWEDFRRLAIQTMEALISAQELHLLHRDLKPSNIMLSWLPSGKFQVKIVDFGLAKFSAKPSLQTIDQGDGVFGSIFFMAPEQFERIPLDCRVDIYAIGCVFYYALTGIYPFDGENPAQVMSSHLQHHVTPIQEVRQGIPVWACDWIMWMVNRQPSDRPENAREALEVFNENDAAYSSPELSSGSRNAAWQKQKKPKLLIPGSSEEPEIIEDEHPTSSIKTATEPKALIPPETSRISSATSYQPSTPASLTASQRSATSAFPVALGTGTQPYVAPGTGTQPHATPESGTQPQATPETGTQAQAAAADPTTGVATGTTRLRTLRTTGGALNTNPAIPATATVDASTQTSQAPTQPADTNALSRLKALPTKIKITIAAVASIVIILMFTLILNRMAKNEENEQFNNLIKAAAQNGVSQIPVNQEQLDILLRNATSVGLSKNRSAIYRALSIAKGTDGTDVDAKIAEFATTRDMIPDVRLVLLRDVLRQRANPAVIDQLLDFVRTTKDKEAAVAAVEATRYMADTTHFSSLLKLLEESEDRAVRKATEDTLSNIIEEASSKRSLQRDLIKAFESARSDELRLTIMRLMGRAGGEDIYEIIRNTLDSQNSVDKIAAIVSLGNSTDEKAYQMLIDYLSTETDLELRNRAYDAAFKFVARQDPQQEVAWTKLYSETKTRDDQGKLIRGLANLKPDPWVFDILRKLIISTNHRPTIELAQRALERLDDIRKIQGPSEDDD